jgi:hypothetical protein
MDFGIRVVGFIAEAPAAAAVSATSTEAAPADAGG